MRKVIVILLIFNLCVGLCACGEESIQVPTRPVSAEDQAAVHIPAAESDETGTTETSPESAEGKYPWEMEFREEDYVKFNITAPNGDKIVTWREGSIIGTERRELYEWADDGTINDTYYYPSGNASHVYSWHTDGSYEEVYYLDNGYVDLVNRITYSGTQVYYKKIEADGSESESFSDENGNMIHNIYKAADGSLSETYFFESGNMHKSFYDDPNTGEYQEQEYFENGNIKFSKYVTPEYTQEECCNEDGYHIYYYLKSAEWEIELTADETGKLVKIIENGVNIEDTAVFTQYASDYNFRE